jgi:transposase-like protein
MTWEGGTLMSADMSARTVRQADGLDPVRDLQRVLYRSAKQDRTRRFHESLNARMRRATRARGHFPDEQAALKCLYLVIRSLDPTGKGRQRWMNRWKPALNAFAITFEGRLFPTA